MLPQPVKIYGLSSKVDGPTVVINVIGMPAGSELTMMRRTTMSTRAKVIEHPNHVLWNFGDSAAHILIQGGHFMGSILAPNATVTANVNVDGNIVANIVNIEGGESHKWDIHPVEPPSFIVDPPQPPQPTQPTEPSQPEQPTNPEQPTDSEQPTEPEQPTDRTEQEQPDTLITEAEPASPSTGVPASAIGTVSTLSQAMPAGNEAKGEDEAVALSQTGADSHSILMGIALAIAAQLMIWGLVQPKKKK